MKKQTRANRNPSGIKRRDFVKSSGAALAGGALLGFAPIPEGKALSKPSDSSPLFPVRPTREGRIQSYRTLGRTGFKVSDISLGGSLIKEANVARYALDKGMNFIDTSEGYENGASERGIRDALRDAGP